MTSHFNPTSVVHRIDQLLANGSVRPTKVDTPAHKNAKRLVTWNYVGAYGCIVKISRDGFNTEIYIRPKAAEATIHRFKRGELTGILQCVETTL